MLENNYSSSMPYSRGQWSSRLAFIFAATGSAVGLGNIWKFTYMAGDNGGGAFIVTYLICIFLIGLPILSCEVLLGRHGKRNTVNIFKRFHRDYGTSYGWIALGWLGIVAGFLILSYYSVIAGWVMAYIFKSSTNAFANMTPEGIGNIFSELVSDPEKLILWHTLFMVITVAVLASGVRNGVERVAKFFIPLLLVLIGVLIVYNINFGNMSRAIDFMFSFDFGKLTPTVVLLALGQAFFSLSIGMGAMMIYGSYLPGSKPLLGTTSAVAIADTTVAILSGLAIFPILFAFNMDPAQGSKLIFNTLPLVFGQMPGGSIFGGLFFFLLLIAAWTSAISLLEPAIAWCIENRGWGRIKTAVLAGLLAWLLGLVTVFSFNHWEDIKLFDRTPFELIDFLSSNILLPLGGLLIVIFAGWVLPSIVMFNEFGLRSQKWKNAWQMTVRYLCPIAIILIFLHLILG